MTDPVGRPPEEGVKLRAAEAYSPDSMEAEATRLMAAAKRGDSAAFDRLVASLRGRAFHVAQGFVGSREDALDLAQETFVKVYRARDTYREEDPFLPWFHRILRNTCYSFLRKTRRVKRASIDAPLGEDGGGMELVDDGPAPGAGIETDELRALFWAGFRTLGAVDREILALRHFQDLSYRDIARALGIPEGTVMSRLFHARRRLRERLGPRLADELTDGSIETH